jgi:hypothetical protein
VVRVFLGYVCVSSASSMHTASSSTRYTPQTDPTPTLSPFLSRRTSSLPRSSNRPPVASSSSSAMALSFHDLPDDPESERKCCALELCGTGDDACKTSKRNVFKSANCICQLWIYASTKTHIEERKGSRRTGALHKQAGSIPLEQDLLSSAGCRFVSYSI